MRLEHWWYTIPLRLRSLLRRTQVEGDLDDEMRFHLERQVAENLAQAFRRPKPAARRYARLTASRYARRNAAICAVSI